MLLLLYTILAIFHPNITETFDWFDELKHTLEDVKSERQMR